ncbi:thioredoxin [Kineosporia sp. NBRC 101677]|nr:thioredoxin [Kineosporia sp. NBRC 101677]
MGDVSLTATTEASFAADVLASPLPVLVEFSADWCPPCQMIAPVLEQIAADEAGRLRVVVLDVDDNPVVADLYQVTAMPTLVLFRAGQEAARIKGVRPRELILAEIAPYL